MKKGFTLAEVLITLAVIGVVAVLTIPSLMTAYKDRQYESADKKMYASILNGFGLMIADDELVGSKSTEEFVEKMKNYFKIAKTCANNELSQCFTEKITKDEDVIELASLKTAKNLGKDSWTTDTNINGVLLNDGTSFLIAYNKDGCTSDSNKEEFIRNCVAVLYDLDSYLKGGIFGKDIRSHGFSSLSTYNSQVITWYNTECECAKNDCCGGSCGAEPLGCRYGNSVYNESGVEVLSFDGNSCQYQNEGSPDDCKALGYMYHCNEYDALCTMNP